MTCVKLLMNTGCRHIYFSEEYPHEDAKAMWEKSGRIWERLDIDPVLEQLSNLADPVRGTMSPS
jgi:deoxycytidylate deaminase